MYLSKIRRTHKDSLFRLIFREKKDLLALYNAQSSFNPNMPIRGLFYFSRLYRKYVAEHKVNLFSSHLKKLPFPRYIIFYNGLSEQPDRTEPGAYGAMQPPEGIFTVYRLYPTDAGAL